MPLFEYECLNCGHVFEVMVKRGGSEVKPTCPECGKADVERLWSPFSGRSGNGTSCGSTAPGFR
jgi:putative FmdB family regulatory protein